MFDWFDKIFRRREYTTDQKTNLEKISKDMNNDIPFPKLKTDSELTQCRTDTPVKIYYRLGLTDNNRVSFQMGYSEITMNKEGVNNLIKQLQVFRDQIKEESEEDES